MNFSRVALVNLNKYIGGGETLCIRFAEFLVQRSAPIPVSILCHRLSYIYSKLSEDPRLNVVGYCGKSRPHSSKSSTRLLSRQASSIISLNHTSMTTLFITFSFRDLLSLILSKSLLSSELRSKLQIVHLALHPEDCLYSAKKLNTYIGSEHLGLDDLFCHQIIKFNTSILSNLDKSNRILFMNNNVKKSFEMLTHYQYTGPIIPLPVCDGLQQITPRKVKIESIVWVGRVVDFKIPSLIAMIDYIAQTDYAFHIIGSGRVSHIKKYIERRKYVSNKYKFYGEVRPEKIKEYVEKCSIGYAMGTSAVLLASYYIPTIVALACTPRLRKLDQISAGLLSDQDPGNLGDDLYASQHSYYPQISDTIQEIDSNYEEKSILCGRYASTHFLASNNFEKYLSLANSSLDCEMSNSSAVTSSLPYNSLKTFLHKLY